MTITRVSSNTSKRPVLSTISTPASLKPAKPIDKESQREDLRRQIAPCEVVIVLPAVYRIAPELVLFQMNFAKAADKPIVAMENFGSTEPLPKAIKDLADEVSAWNERNLIDALRRQARHQETTRWDTIDFKLD